MSWMRECPYELCDGDGLIVDEATNTAYDCRCRAQRIAQAKARSLSRVIPKRFEDVAFDRPPIIDVEPRATVEVARRFAETIDRQIDAGTGIAFQGPVGTGKTALAMCVTKAALNAGRSVAIFPLPKLLSVIRDSYGPDRSYVQLADQLARVELLHIDDLGAERTTEWVLEELYTIVNARYEDKRSIVFTTNLDSPSMLA